MFYIAGKLAECGSKIRKGWVAPNTSTVVARLEKAGAILTTVETALTDLRAKGFSMRITGDSRVAKHEQRFTERHNLGRREAAIMCVLGL